MNNDSLIDEVRNNGLVLVARYDNDVEAICKALEERESASGRMVVDRAPQRLRPKSHGEGTQAQNVSIT